MQIIDYIIVGAGINGVSIAHFLQQKYSALLIDKSSIKSNASLNAGAFLSPMIGLNSNIKSLIDISLPYALEFYKTLNLDSFIQNGLLKLPKNQRDKIKFEDYKKCIKFKYKELDSGIFFEDGAIINPKELFEKLILKVNFQNIELNKIEYIDGYYQIGEFKAKNLILTRGFEENLEPYITPRAIWGQKILIKSKTKVPFNIHKDISISTTQKDDSIVIGATHQRDIREQTPKDEITQELISQAKEMFELKDIELIRADSGVRSAGNDFMPVVGKVVDSTKSLSKYANIIHGERGKWHELEYYPNLYIINQVGGRGFVLAPYLCKILIDYIENNKEIDNNLKSERLFYRYFRKQNYECN